MSYTPKSSVAALIAAGKAWTTTLVNYLWDNDDYNNALIGSHLHTGADGSSLIPVGPNYLRNPSFEDNTSGWTLTAYTGGTVQRVTATNLDGAASLSFTSTSVANGGGDAVSDEYVPVTGGRKYTLTAAVLASVANISSEMEIVWYDNTHAQISTTDAWYSTNTPTTNTRIGLSLVAPATARFMRVKLIGGVPSIGSAYGTIYYDGLRLESFNAAVPLYRTTISSAVSSVDVTSAVDWTAFDRYRVVMTGLHGTAAADLWMRVSVDGGSTFNTGSNYKLFPYGVGATADSKFIIGQLLNTTGSVCNAEVAMKRPGVAAIAKTMTYQFEESDGSINNNIGAGGATYLTSTLAIAGIRIMASTGNLDLGSVAIFGEMDS